VGVSWVTRAEMLSHDRCGDRMQQGMKQQPPKIEVEKAEEYRSVFASGVYGGLNPSGGALIFYADRLVPEPNKTVPGQMILEKIVQELQVEVRITPAQWKAMVEWMKGNLETYEKTFGEVKLGPTGTKDAAEPSVAGYQ